MGALKLAENTKKKYEENPKLCKFCGTPIPYEKRHSNKYCNHSCSAKYNNAKRSSLKKCITCGTEIKNGKHKKYCSRKCQHDYQYKKFIESWKNGEVTGNVGKPGSSVSNHIKRYLREKYHDKCCECGWNKKHPIDKKSPLQVEHIDGDSTNNKEDNLKLLCPNCHSLTLTYGARNKNSTRHYRYNT
jgi:hypothetical protein